MNVVPKLRTIFGFAFGGVMYKLLLVSDKEEIRSLYRRYAEWNTLGFEQPDVAENAQQGIDLLSHRRYDAISSLLSVSEGKKFFAYLSRRPEMLGMETARDEAHLRREISTARRALSTRDASRQSKQVDDYTKALQGEFFCDLLRGAAFDCTKIDERMQSLKLDALDAARPVVTSSFRLPQGDYFLSEVWRYGRDRLENALKNIFENGDPKMAFVLLIINPAGAGEAIRTIVENFLYYPSAAARLRYLGNTLVKTAPLLMCSLSVLFAYKVGLFNIGAAGQYVIGAGASLYCALGFGLPWYVCLLAAIAAGAVLGAISGLLKAYRNVNEVISCIMLNWISLYLVNALLSQVKETASPYTFTLSSTNPDAILPSLGLGALFSDNQYVTIAIPLTVIVAVGIWVLLEKTKLGYELRATGCNKFAAKYCGMKEKRNIILTMAIAGGLAGMGAATLFLTGFEQWQVTQSAVPAMGFNGIAAAFLGGLNPIGAIFSSYFIQHITNGGAYVDKTMYSAQISDLISALIIYLCGFVLFFKVFMNSRLDRRDEKRRAKEDRPGSEEGGKA